MHQLHRDVDAIHPCLFGIGFFFLLSAASTAALVNHIPYQLQNGIFVRFVPHADRENHRAELGFSTGWLMFLGLPLDYRNDYDINNAIATFGKCLHWHQDQDMIERTLVYVSFPSITRVPRDIVFWQLCHYGWSKRVMDCSMLYSYC